MSGDVVQAGSRNRHYAVDLKRYYRMPAVQASLTTVLSIFIVAFFIMVAIRPTLNTVATLKQNIETAEKTLKQLKAKERAVQQAAALYEQLTPKVPLVNRAVPLTGAEYNNLTKTIEVLATQTGATLSSVTIGESVLYSELIRPYEGRDRTVMVTPITIRVTGDYQTIRAFFSQITNIDRLMDIDTMSIGRDAGNRGATTSVSLSLNGKVAYLADEEVLKNVLVGKEKK